MANVCDDDAEIPLKDGLDLYDLRQGEGQVFEIDEDQMINTDYDDFCNEGYKHFGQDFIADEEEEVQNSGDNVEFDKIALKMVNLTPDGGVKKQIISQGVGEVVPKSGCVTVHYNAYLELADEPHDSTYMRQSPLRFTLGTGMVIPGLDIAVSTMRKKEKARFLIISDYNLGDQGCPPRVPAKATCLYVVELISFADAEGVDSFQCMSKHEKSEAPFEQVLQAVRYERKEANERFKKNQFYPACRGYKRAIDYLENYHLKTEEEEVIQQKELRGLYQNLAVTNLKLSNNYGAIKYANEALRLDSKSPRAYYVKGKALRMLGEFQPALKALETANKLMPNKKDVATELTLLDKQKKDFDDFERNCCRRMFGNVSISSSTGNANRANAEKAEVSAKFKEVIVEKLNTFKDDPELIECPFSTNSITLTELRAVAEHARSMGLYVTDEKCQNKITHIRVCKNRPETVRPN